MKNILFVLITCLLASNSFAQDFKSMECQAYRIQQENDGSFSLHDKGIVGYLFNVSYGQRVHTDIVIEAVQTTPNLFCAGSCPGVKVFARYDTISEELKVMTRVSAFDMSTGQRNISLGFETYQCF